MFLSRQRGDLSDFRCLGAQETRFFAEFGAQALRAESVSFEVSWVTLGSPRSVPELSWLLWAAGLLSAAPGLLLGCSWAAPTTEPQAHPEHDT